jgi:phosphoesterase RecJ-like protein
MTGLNDKAKILQLIRDKSSFLVTAHQAPEPDAMGSSIALALALRGLGKKARVVNVDPLPRVLRFLSTNQLVARQRRITERPDALFVLDCGDLERTALFETGRTASQIPFPVVNIDHHLTNTRFGTYNWIEPHAAATAELIYELMQGLQSPMTAEIATSLYTALVGETGSFRYSNTTARVFHLAARLVEEGAEPFRVSRELFESDSPGRLKLLHRLLGTLTRSFDGRVAWVTVTRRMLRETRTGVEDTENLVNYPRSLGGVDVAVLFREEQPRLFKISLRSKGRVNVAAAAQRFGGGGHHNAAGCKLSGSLPAVRRAVLRAVREEMREK